MTHRADALGLLVCPNCFGSLDVADHGGECARCGTRCDLVHGIAVVRGSDDYAVSSPKAQQAAYFDQDTDPEWEIERPRGAPALHRWMIEEKFRRSVSGLVGLSSTSGLAVCGGSGMDAELLARAGANVVSTDISLGAAKRAAERAHRHDVSITVIVADAERLPFANHSFDLVYVHDGLHHLEQPYAGLSEMLRVAGRAVSITEPADAALTRLAVRGGVAEEVEEAGNRVERLRLDDVVAAVERADFRILHAERYAMFYRHHPGWAMRAFSREPLLTAAKATMRTGNRVFGRLGNKLVVVAVRS